MQARASAADARRRGIAAARRHQISPSSCCAREFPISRRRWARAPCPAAPSSTWAPPRSRSATTCTRPSSAPTSSSPSATTRSRSRLSSWAPNGPKVIHVGYQPAQCRAGLLPAGRGRRRPWPLAARCWPTASKARSRNAQALLPLREGILSRIAARATEDRFTPQRIVHDVRAVMPADGIVALDNGMYKIWFARNYRTRVANTLLLDNALATMGAGPAVGDDGRDALSRSAASWPSAATAAS